MSEVLQEYVDSRHERLRVDRAAGVIRGVKLLGLHSRNGRRYREDALSGAIGLYEGAKVNINHPKGHPLAPRDYQDRLGVVRGVELRAGEGLFGDLHLNPKHALSEQLIWDAEHAPQNVGMSHNVLARTKREGDAVVVEAITKVQSIDLVADPATTSGLYEHVEARAAAEKRGNGAAAGGASPPVLSGEQRATRLETVTLEQLEQARPDLVLEIQHSLAPELEQLRQQLDELAAKESALQRRERILQLLQEFELPLPSSGHREGKREVVSELFVKSLMGARDEAEMRQLVEERAALVRSAGRWSDTNPRDRRPRSRDQLLFSLMSADSRPGGAAEFAAALRGG